MRVSVPYAPGTLTLTGHDLSGNVVTNSTVASWGTAVAVVLTVDAPSPNSGTGSKLYLDGEVRARGLCASEKTIRKSGVALSLCQVVLHIPSLTPP